MQAKIERRLARFFYRRTVPLPANFSVVSFTFDDVLASACTRAADMIAAAGGRATYYVSGNFEQKSGAPPRFFSAQQLRDLVSAGHEIGCHGFSHLNYQEVAISDIETDIEKNRAYFTEIGVPVPRHFAYPYGCVSPNVKKACARYFASCRGIHGKVNRGVADLNLLGAFPLSSATHSKDSIDSLLDHLRRSSGWLIFFSHGIMERPGPFDATPELLAYTLDGVNQRGIAIANISDALQLLSSKA